MSPTRVYSLWQTVDMLWKRAGPKYMVRVAVTDESVCVCVSTNFGHVTWSGLEIMRLFVTGHSHCHAPFLPVDPNSQSAFLWLKTLHFLNLVQVCESIWKLCAFFHKPLPLPRLLLANWHKHTHTHLTSMPNFSLKPTNKPTDSPTDHQTELTIEVLVASLEACVRGVGGQLSHTRSSIDRHTWWQRRRELNVQKSDKGSYVCH